jgi:DNA replication protein DnaC
MICDEIIDQSLMKYPMTADTLSTNNFTIIVGGMGKGKSSLCTSLATQPMKRCYTHMIVLMPARCRTSMKPDIFGNNASKKQLDSSASNLTVFDTISGPILKAIEEFLEETTTDLEHTIIIIDDFQALYKQPDIALALEAIITRIRHFRCTVWLLAQNWSKIPKNLREICQNLIAFDIGKSQFSKVYDDKIQTMSRPTFDALIKHVYTEPHDWALFNFHKSQRIYKNWDGVVIS